MSPGLPHPSGRTATLVAVILATAASLIALAAPTLAAPAVHAGQTRDACPHLNPKVIKSTTGLKVAKGKVAPVIDDSQESGACLWSPNGVKLTGPQVARGAPGVYLALVVNDALDPGEEEDDDTTTTTLAQQSLTVPGASKVTVSQTPGGGGSTLLITFTDGTGAYAFVGSVKPSTAAITTLATAIVKAHG